MRGGCATAPVPQWPVRRALPAGSGFDGVLGRRRSPLPLTFVRTSMLNGTLQ